MNIPINQESQTLIGHPIVKGGVIKIEFKCAHDRVQIMFGEVLCISCRKVLNNQELGIETC